MQINNGVVIVAGATASGKTRFAIDLALFLRNRFGYRAEIINADNIQMYNELKILTACPSESDMAQVKHHMFNILSPNESSSVIFWLNNAQDVISRLREEKKIAIICGGTGFYINSIVNGISNIPEIPETFREHVKQKFQTMGRDAFFNELSKLDAFSAKILHKNDTQRILRAYEVASFTGKSLSVWWKENVPNEQRLLASTLILSVDKNMLRKKCQSRITHMMQTGAIEEVEAFRKKCPNYNGPLCKVIGYKEISRLLDGEISECTCSELLCCRTMQYAKRQSTWFRNKMSFANFISPDTFNREAEISVACSRDG
jgi:tRNA dimethylallyltransferase